MAALVQSLALAMRPYCEVCEGTLTIPSSDKLLASFVPVQHGSTARQKSAAAKRIISAVGQHAPHMLLGGSIHVDMIAAFLIEFGFVLDREAWEHQKRAILSEFDEETHAEAPTQDAGSRALVVSAYDNMDHAQLVHELQLLDACIRHQRHKHLVLRKRMRVAHQDRRRLRARLNAEIALREEENNALEADCKLREALVRRSHTSQGEVFWPSGSGAICRTCQPLTSQLRLFAQCPA